MDICTVHQEKQRRHKQNSDHEPVSPGQHRKNSDEDHPIAAVIRMQKVRSSSQRQPYQRTKPPHRQGFIKLRAEKAQQQRHHHALVFEGKLSVEQKVKGDLRKKHANGQPKAITEGAAGMDRTLCEQEAVDGKSQTADHTQNAQWHQHGANVVDQHA